MSKTLNIAFNDLRIFLSNAGNLFSIIVVPVVLTVIIGVSTGGSSGPERLRVDVLDNDNSLLSAQFLSAVREANSALVLCPMDNADDDFCDLVSDRGEAAAFTPELADERLNDQTSLALIEIPSGYAEALQAGEDATIVYGSNENITAPNYISQAVTAAAQEVGGALVAARVGTRIADDFDALEFDDEADRAAFTEGVFNRANDLRADNPVQVDFHLTEAEDDESSGVQNGFGQSVPGIGSMSVMFTIFTALNVLVAERKIWTLQRLVMMPLSTAQILGGKIITWVVIGMIQYIVVFIVGLVVGVNFGSDLVALLLVMLAFSVCITALTFALAPILRTDAQAGSIGLLLGLTLAPLGGAWWPLDIVPDVMRIVGHLSPIAWAMDGFNSLIFYGGNLLTVLPSIGVLLLMAVVFFAFAVSRFRYQ
ncbi:MAG: ABC transporter permease [Burkholderiales bacterium]|nr:ABC transporter permease [Anaerolineae bacterium]